MTALEASLVEMCAEVTVMKKALGDMQSELRELKKDHADNSRLAKELAETGKQFEQIRLSLAVVCGKTVVLRTSDGKMLTGKHGQFPVAASSGLDDNAERFTVEFAGNGKVSLKSCGKYLSASYGNDYKGYIYCNARSVGKAEVFEWIVNEDGTISLRGHNGKFASVNKDLADRLTCSGNFHGGSERFVVVVC